MTKFIDVSNDTKEVKKETVFTHGFNTLQGWEECEQAGKDFSVIKYLGKCNVDGDMFACITISGTIAIYKGIKGDEFN